MSKIYLYDGKYHSLLALIFELLKNKIEPFNIKSEAEYEISLLDETVYLKVNFNSLNILKKMPSNINKTIYYLFLSNHQDKELLIYNFLKYFFKYKNQVLRYRNLDVINEVIKAVKYVGTEAHKYKGFLRFKFINHKFYYGKIEPNNNIIPILAYHFKERLNEPWIIHDIKRNICAIYDLKKVTYLSDFEMNFNFDSEEEFEDLWKLFFKTIAIKERKNLKCQKNFMPKRYWNQMLEMENET